jgi:hypothetical protein
VQSAPVIACHCVQLDTLLVCVCVCECVCECVLQEEHAQEFIKERFETKLTELKVRTSSAPELLVMCGHTPLQQGLRWPQL